MTETSVANGYPADWKDISLAIRERSRCIEVNGRPGGRCECEGECGLHRTHPGPRQAVFAKGKVVLTVAHLNHTPADCRPENLKAMCQRCHLRYDVDHHRASIQARVRREREEAGQLAMPEAFA